MMHRMGHTHTGEALAYDDVLFEFRLGTVVTPLSDLAILDAHGQIHWRAMEQRDWFRKIDPAALEAANKRAVGEAMAGGRLPEEMDPHDQVRTDAARDDSILAGKIVGADDEVVQAVLAALAAQGITGAGMQGVPGAEGPVEGAQVAPGAVGANPLAAADLPKGMEALSQFERAQGGERKMTRSEERLMRKILKNDDKEKARREKEAKAIAEANEKAEAKAEEKREKATGAAGDINVDETTEEELALLEMRQKNLEQNMQMQRNISSPGKVGGLLTNPDGSPKNTGVVGKLRVRKKFADEKRDLEEKQGGRRAIRQRKREREEQQGQGQGQQPPRTAGGNYADAEGYADASTSTGRFGAQQGQGGMMGGGGMGGGPGGGGGGMGGGPGGGGGGGVISQVLNVVQQVLRIVSSLTGRGGGGGGGMGGGGGGGMGGGGGGMGGGM